MTDQTKPESKHITTVDELYFKRLIKKQIQLAIEDRILINLPLSVQRGLVALIWEDRLNAIYDDLKAGKYADHIHELMLR